MIRSLVAKLPLADLRSFSLRDLRRDLPAALTVTFMAIPQGIAYAMIAGLPPEMGLYAGFLPTIIGSLLRSSRQVITGPTNALSLLVAASGASSAHVDPVSTAVLLALIVGVIQLAAGTLRLGVVVDFISMPVVVGYITGAGVLIGVGQLPNLTATLSGSGNLIDKITTWATHATAANLLAVGVGLGTACIILGLRRWNRSLPSELLALGAATTACWLLELGSHGLLRVADLAPVPSGLPPIVIPTFTGWTELLPLAAAATVLSLVESSAVARGMAARSGQTIDVSFEFIGQGLANIAAGISGGYPTSGSPSRSALNATIGADSRVSGVLSGVFVGVSLLFLGPVIDYTPIAGLAGLLLIVGFDLIDRQRIRIILGGRRSDVVAFAATVIGTWILPLDKAIYVGVGVSIIFFLRRARVLHITPIEVRANGDVSTECSDVPKMVRLLQVDGNLFFAGASDLCAALDRACAAPQTRVVILRLRRAVGLDVTTAMVLSDYAARYRAFGKRLMLTGVSETDRTLFESCGVLDRIGPENIRGRSVTIYDSLRIAIADAQKDLQGNSQQHSNTLSQEEAPQLRNTTGNS